MYTTTINSTPFVPESTPSLGKKVGNFVASHAPSLSILCLKIAAVAVSVFGKWGQKAADYFRREANKIYFIHILHPQYRVRQAPLPILVPSVNLARRKVIYNEGDIASANRYRDTLLSEKFQKKISPYTLDTECHDKLRITQFRGARTQGICQAASLLFIQTVLQRTPTSEQALKEIAAIFEQGFPKEPAGLYEIYEVVEPASRKKIKDEMDREFAKIGDLVDKSETEQELAVNLEKAKNLHAIAKRRLVELKQKTFHIYTALLGMRLKDSLEKSFDCDFSNFLSQKETLERFDSLQTGVYYLGFSTDTSGHAIALLKYDFGTYLFDPNKGLLKCDASKPSDDFAKLYQSYRKSDEAYLLVFPTVLAPQASP